jgi:hypothetical protein
MIGLEVLIVVMLLVVGNLPILPAVRAGSWYGLLRQAPG